MKNWLAIAAATVGAAAWVGMGSDRIAGATPTGKAPEIRSARWINSPPLSPQSLRGKVVAVEFWTYG